MEHPLCPHEKTFRSKDESEKEYLKTIEDLEKSVKESEHDVYLCGECEYSAECIHDFNDHTHSPEDFEKIAPSLLTCNFCDEKFETKREVMRHNKLVHASNVQHCNKFLENTCFYGDSCWFLHSESFRDLEPSFKCNFCEQKFLSLNHLREHMKKLHIKSVTKCKNEIECKFGQRKCWFVHIEDIEIEYKVKVKV